MVALLWLEVGRDEGSMELSLLRFGRSIWEKEPYTLPRLLSVEFCLVNPGGVAVLHLLLTLSLRLSMALCTKPPIPLVGDAGRVGDDGRSRSGDILPWVGDMASPRAALALSPPSTEEPGSNGGANFWESSTGSGERVLAMASASPPDIDVLAEKRLLIMALPRAEPPREPGGLDTTLSGGGLLISASVVESRDMPGSCLLPDMASASGAPSSWLRRYAAEFAPRSGVWRK